MDSLQKEHDRLTKRSNLGKVIKDVDNILSQLSSAREQLISTPENSHHTLTNLSSITSIVQSTLQDDQKDIYNSQNKYGKVLDKKFKASSSFLGSEYDALSEHTPFISRAVARHLIREGNFDVANTFLKEAGEKGVDLDVEDGLTREFTELYEILDAMKVRRDLGPAIAWARNKAPLLEARGSNLEFELCQLQYIWLFMGEGSGVPGNQKAMIYAKSEFGRFQTKYLSQIEKLVTAYAYVRNLDKSPYATLFLDAQQSWASTAYSFAKEFCSLLGLSAESPLYIAATAGAIALPTLLKMASIMKEKKTEWSSQNELPVEIPLPPNYHFHSIFVCPVSKDQTTEDNPPMMLPCGHVIAQESLQRLAKGGNAVTLKCPYCPKECTAAQAKRVYV